MKLLVYLNVNNSIKGGLYRSVFERNKRLVKDRNIIDDYKIISVTDDYIGFLKMFNTKKGYMNYIEKNVSGFNQDNIKCDYVKIKTGVVNRIMDKVSIEYNILRRFEKIIKNIDITQYDLISVHTAYPDGLVANRIKNKYDKSYIITLHGSDINIQMNKSKDMRKKIIKVLEEAERCIFVSTSLLNTAIEYGYSGKNAIVIPNGYDESKFRILEKEKIKKELMLEGIIVGFAGNLQAVKRADKLPEIFKYIKDIKEDITFVIIGDGPEKENIINECNKVKVNLEMIGRVELDDVPKYMNIFDILILPSRNEGWPCVIFEAIACGAKVVGADVGGIKEAIGNFGAIVKESKSFEKDFAEAVVKELYQYRCENQVKNYIDNFKWDTVAEKEKNLYEEVAFRL